LSERYHFCYSPIDGVSYTVHRHKDALGPIRGTPQDAEAGEGWQEFRPPVHDERYSPPDMGVYIGRLECRNMRLRSSGSSRTHAVPSTAFVTALEGHGQN
jgi:hypothetical protein